MYDIIVFDPALVSDDEFPVWWEEGAPVEAADDPGAMTPGLQSLYHELRRYFPAMDGPDAVDDATLLARPGMGGYVADYGFGPRHMYISVGWDRVEDLLGRFYEAAPRHGVAIARVDACEILRP
jgi:hypothetical protein avisC_07019